MSVVALLDRSRSVQGDLREERRTGLRSAPVPFVPKPIRRGWLDLEGEIAEEFATLSSHIDRREGGLRIFREDGTRKARWYAENRQHALAYASAYNKAHRPEINERRRERYATDTKAAQDKQRRYIEDHRDAHLRYRRRRYRAHRDEILAPMRQAYKEGPGAARQAARASRAAGRVCGWGPCGKPIVPPERGGIPEFCDRRCRDAATRAAARAAKATTKRVA